MVKHTLGRVLELEGLTPSHLVSELSEMLGTAGQRYNQSVANLSSLVRDTQLSPLEVRQLERSTNSLRRFISPGEGQRPLSLEKTFSLLKTSLF